MIVAGSGRDISNLQVPGLDCKRMSRAAPMLGLVYLLGCSSPPSALLLYTRTTGFRHDSIVAGVAALRTLAAQDGIALHHTEDPAVFAAGRLRGYAAVVFLHTTGDMLDDAGVQALDGFVRAGGGFLGIHAAADALYGSSTYREVIGALFLSHPALQTGILVVEDDLNPATRQLPARWQHADEFYDFRSNPRGNVRVLLRVDETSYQGGGMGPDHPIAWCHSVGKGRAFYTALGHPIESWSEPLFLEHVRGGLRIAAGVLPANCSPN